MKRLAGEGQAFEPVRENLVQKETANFGDAYRQRLQAPRAKPRITSPEGMRKASPETTEQPEIQTGFIPRPRTEDYVSLFSFGSGREDAELGAAYFQLQQREAVQALLSRTGTTRLVTQGMDQAASRDKSGVDILAPNTVTKGLAEKIRNADVLNARSGSLDVHLTQKDRTSFHPKIGYVKGGNKEDDRLYAFLGTQNITPALDKNATLESLLVLDAKAKDMTLRNRRRKIESASEALLSAEKDDTEIRKAAIEQAAGQEVIGLTQDLIQTAKGDKQQFFRNTALKQFREQRQHPSEAHDLTSNFTLLNEQILEEYNEVLKKSLEKAEDKTQSLGKVYLSVNRMDALLDRSSPQAFRDMKENLKRLAQRGKLSVVTDREQYRSFLERDRRPTLSPLDKQSRLTLPSTGKLPIHRDRRTQGQVVKDALASRSSLDEDFLETLAENKALQFSPVPMHHEKGIAITDQQDRIVYGGIQSANITQAGMPRENRDDVNTEVMLRFAGSGFGPATPTEKERQKVKREEEAIQTYLSGLGLKEHFQAYSRESFVTGYATERNADPKQVYRLKEMINTLDQQAGGGVFSVKERYEPTLQGYKDPVGLRVRIASAYEGQLRKHNLELDLTVNEEGNVVLSDQSKLIGQTLLLNKSGSDVTLPGTGSVVKPKESRQLSSKQTATGLLATMASELSYQNRYGLVNQKFSELMGSNRRNAARTTGGILSETLVGLMKARGVDLVDRKGGALDKTPSLEQVLSNLPEEAQQGYDLKTAYRDLIDHLSKTDVNTGRAITDAVTRRVRRQKLESVLGPVFQKREELGSGLSQRLKETFLTFKHILTGAPGPDVSKPVALLEQVNQRLEEDARDRESYLEDLRALAVARDPAQREAFSAATQTQSRSVLSTVFDPFLQPHDQETTFMQTKASLPVYSVRPERMQREEQSRYAAIAQLGVMDPGEFGHADQLGQPGRYQRPLAATAFPDAAHITGFGGLSQVKTINQSDIHSGAAKVYDMELLMRGVSGYQMLSREGFAQELANIEYYRQRSLGKQPDYQALYQSKYRELKEQFTDEQTKQETSLYLLPYNKEEQLTQRFKNVTGARGAKDVDPELVRKLLELETEGSQITYEDIANLHTGQIRPALPEEQWEQLQQVLASGAKQPIQELRRQDLEPLNQNKGVIGSSKLKRVALHGGFNTLGDYGVVNAGFDQPVAETKPLKLTVGFQQMESTTQFFQQVSDYLKQGVKVIGSGSEKERGLYVFREQEGRWVREGQFDDSGLIEIPANKVMATRTTGLREESAKIKIGAEGKAFESGVTLLSGELRAESNARQTLRVEQDATTIWYPGTGHRQASGGQLPKFPAMVGEQETFERVQQTIESRRLAVAQEGKQPIGPGVNVSDQLYSLNTLDQFKGFTYETGLALLSDETSREQVRKQTPTQIAQGLALLYAKDEDVRSALAQSLRRERKPAMASAIEETKGKVSIDASDSKSLGLITKGLSYLEGGQDLKSKVVKTLKGEKLAEGEKDLTTATQELVNLVLNKEQYSRTVEDRKVLRESSSVVKSAGLLAHTSYFAQQLFSSGGFQSVGGLYETKVISPEDYLNIRKQEPHGLTSEQRRRKDFAEFLAASTGMRIGEEEDEEGIKRKLNLLQAFQEQDFVLETIADMTPSKSLVSAGQKDEVAFEFHYLLGLSNQHLNKFRDQSKLQSELASVQEDYSTLSAAVAGGFHKTAFNQLPVKLGIQGREETLKGFIDRKIEIEKLV
ncbi:MAG: hypothetical protein ABEK59_02870 [Halobacteria archaeon]